MSDRTPSTEGQSADQLRRAVLVRLEALVSEPGGKRCVQLLAAGHSLPNAALRARLLLRLAVRQGSLPRENRPRWDTP